MEKEFVPYELALKLRELGFDEECFGWWSWINGIAASLYTYPMKNSNMVSHNMHPNNASAPLWQQAFDWFRYVMLLDNFIIPYWFIDGECKVKKYTYSIEPSNRFDEYFNCDSDQYDTYEEAREECLKKLIELSESSCQKPGRIN